MATIKIYMQFIILTIFMNLLDKNSCKITKQASIPTTKAIQKSS